MNRRVFWPDKPVYQRIDTVLSSMLLLGYSLFNVIKSETKWPYILIFIFCVLVPLISIHALLYFQYRVEFDDQFVYGAKALLWPWRRSKVLKEKAKVSEADGGPLNSYLLIQQSQEEVLIPKWWFKDQTLTEIKNILAHL